MFKSLLQNWVDIFGEDVFNTVMDASKRYFALTNLEKSEQYKLFVRFNVHLVSNIGREGED